MSEVITNDVNEKSGRSWVALLLLSIFFGYLGFDRFYAGKIWTGILKAGLFVVGVLTTVIFIGFVILPIAGVWTLFDLIMIICGKFKDVDGKYVKG